MKLGRRHFLGFTLAACTRRAPSAGSSAPSAGSSAPTAGSSAPTAPGVATAAANTERFDLVVRNGMLLDGLGTPARRTDVGVRSGTIVFIGDLARAEGTVIDAAGAHVCPGFIDLHSHADDTFDTHPDVESAIRQGITTVVVGQDGSSIAPAKQTFAAYQEAREKRPSAVNVASFVGQGQLRSQVMGDRAGPASPTEMAKMQALAREALAAGAFGISSGLEYLPGANARREELTNLCRVLVESRAIYATHLRNEDDTLLEAIEEAIAIAKDSGARLHVSHLKASGKRNWPKLPQALALLDAAGATADAYPYVAYATTLQNLFPPELRAGGTKTFLAALRDPQRAPKLRAAAEAKVAMLGSWDSVMLTGLRHTARKAWDGRHMGELAESLHRPAIDVVVDLLLENEGNVGMLGFGMSEENLARTIAHPRVAIASDGSALAVDGALAQRKAHPRSYGTFPRVLARLVRERGVLALPDAIAKMTSLPAGILGLAERGRIAVGAAADLVVFAPAVIEDRATFEDAHRYPVGISHVVVNGALTIERERHHAVRAGRVLRRT